MIITKLKSKIHRARVTSADLHYIGSIEIDKHMMDSVGMRNNEKVLVVNITNGKRWETYVIPAEEKSKIIAVNGGGAQLCAVGDILVIMAFAQINEDDLLEPKIILLDEKNNII